MAVLKINGLGKEYKIGAPRARYSTLRESIVGALRRPSHGRAPGHKSPTIWALRDVSFEVQPGEVVGIIGRNGAGKSTLLKILSRITEPSTGTIELFGRVGSLLEVGTGFHPELTGRDNIYLNGAIMGMSRLQINSKFDAIVDFAGVERFLETPVKHYSSGMYTRLAFSVAAHMDPEILLVDEVLAVGDAAFQSKCIGKMQGVAREGRTVLFVSHQMAAIEALCTRCILLADGRLQSSGPPREIAMEYLGLLNPDDAGQTRIDSTSRPRLNGSAAIMREVTVSRGDSIPTALFQMGSALAVHVSFVAPRAIQPVLGVVVKTAFGLPLFGINNRLVQGQIARHPCGEGIITCRFDDLPLMPGKYNLDLFFGDPIADLDVVTDAISFEVVAVDVFGTGKLPPASAGPVFVPARWIVTESPTVISTVGAGH
jgi:lipopolysaccharide transport system ATP-binding protein